MASRAGRRAARGQQSAADLDVGQRFDVLLAELRTVLGPQYDQAGLPGYDEAAAIAALRAIVGISVPTAVRDFPLRSYAGVWSEALQQRIVPLLLDVGSRNQANRDMIGDVIDSNRQVRS